jgi:hypothetical protein
LGAILHNPATQARNITLNYLHFPHLPMSRSVSTNRVYTLHLRRRLLASIGLPSPTHPDLTLIQ